ncbi:MAG TPA: hypothetical protein PLU47_10410 [Azonexus sp.]|nr:hypothetical protein [Azonexus sp.]
MVAVALVGAGFIDGTQAQEVRAVMTSSCPTSTGPEIAPGAEALPALLGPILVSFAGSLVDTGVAALKKAVNPDAMTVGGSFLQSGIYLWEPPPAKEGEVPDLTKAKVRLNPEIGCIVIAVGEFKKGSPAWVPQFAIPNQKKDTAVADLQALLGLSSEPSLLFEAAFKTSDDRSAVTWRPRRIYVGKFLNSSFWAGDSRGLQISFSLMRPGSEKAVYTQEFKFDHVVKGFSRVDDELDGGQQGTWGVLPANAKDKPGGKPSRSTALDPFTLTVQLVETPKPYKLAQAFAGAVEANKDAIKTEVALLVDPAKKEAADKAAVAAVLTAKDGSITAVQAYLEAWKTASDSCATSKIGDATGKVSCKLALDKARVARTKAEAACGSTDAQACTEMSALVLPPPEKP